MTSSPTRHDALCKMFKDRTGGKTEYTPKDPATHQELVAYYVPRTPVELR
jgi:hypothetical protein